MEVDPNSMECLNNLLYYTTLNSKKKRKTYKQVRNIHILWLFIERELFGAGARSGSGKRSTSYLSNGVQKL